VGGEEDEVEKVPLGEEKRERTRERASDRGERKSERSRRD